MHRIHATTEKDTLLLIGLQQSDSMAIREVYDLALPSVLMDIRSNNGNEADGRDVFQDALLALFKRLKKSDFELTCTLQSYLRIMCKRLWLTKLRDGKKIQYRSIEGEELVDFDDTVGVGLEKAAKRRIFYKHLAALGEKCQIILKAFFQKKPLSEIAEQLETSVGYVKKRKFLCKEKLIEAVRNDPMFEELKT